MEDCLICPPVKDGYEILDWGYESWAYDEESEMKLWEMSKELVGFKEG